MLVEEAKISLVCYFLGLSNLLLYSSINGVFSYSIVLHPTFLLAVFYLVLSPGHFQYAIRAAFLGAVFGLGVILQVNYPEIRAFGWYSIVLSVFHFSEFFSIALINPKSLKLDSFLLNHSLNYLVAAVLSWIEFWVEYYFFADIKCSILNYIGLVMCICGELIRKAGMFTACASFDHIVQTEKPDNHKLVTHGIYGVWRHPSYVGWFWWSIGTQIILVNPLCCLGYTLASWMFFYSRVLSEELTLIEFYGDEYVQYQRNVPTGLPFIHGYVVTN